MVKNRRRKQKQRNQQTSPLEALLRSDESVLYGQVCWSIANRDTELPRTGEVIVLERGYEDGGHAGMSFHLTHKSIENVRTVPGIKDLW